MKHLVVTPNIRVAKFGLTKGVLSLTDKHDCTKCKLRKEGISPLFEAKPIPRNNNEEKIIVIIHDYPYSAAHVFTPEQDKILREATIGIKVDRIINLPAVFCAHDKSPTKLMLTKCSTRIKAQLDIIKPNVVILMGKGPCALFNISGIIDKIKMGVFEIHGLPKIDGDNPKLIITDSMEKIQKDYGNRILLREDLIKAERACKKQSAIKPPDNYFLMESAQEAMKWVDEILVHDKEYILAADIETNGKSHVSKKGKMRCISFCWRKNHAVCFPFEEDPEGYLLALRKLFASNMRLLWHNGIFDVAFLKYTYDLYSAHNYADSMLDAYLLQPGKGKYGYGLKGLALQHTDLGAYDTEVHDEEDDKVCEVVVEKDNNGVEVLVTKEPLTKWEKVPMITLATYNCGDVDASWQLFVKFRPLLADKGMLRLSRIMSECSSIAVDFESNGCLINKELVDACIPKLEKIIEGYAKELETLVGSKYDWNSPPEMAKVLYDKLKYKSPYGPGTRPTDDSALDILNTPFTEVFRKYRTAFKLCSTYYKGYLRNAVSEDGRLHGRYWIVATNTCRLSSTEPNMQNFPREMAKYEIGYKDLHEFKAKNAIIAPKGWTLIAADQSQAEMRVAGILSGDPELLKLYRNGIDLHSLNAKVCFNIKTDLTDIKKKMAEEGWNTPGEAYDIELLKRELKIVKKEHDSERTAAKSVSFGILYGMSEYGLKRDLDGKTRHQGKVWTLDECRTMIARFHTNFKVLSKWLTTTQRFAKKYGYVKNIFGFRRPLPAVWSDVRKDRADAMRQAINTPVQGSAWLIMALGMSTAQRRLDRTRAKLIMTVHDSVVLEVRNDYIDEAVSILRDSLTHPLFEGKPLDFLNLPLEVDIEKGDSYGNLTKIKVE